MEKLNLELLEGPIGSPRFYRASEIQFLLNIIRKSEGLEVFPYQGLSLKSLAMQVYELSNKFGLTLSVAVSVVDIGKKLRQFIDFMISNGEFSMDDLIKMAENEFPSLPPEIRESIQSRLPRPSCRRG